MYFVIIKSKIWYFQCSLYIYLAMKYIKNHIMHNKECFIYYKWIENCCEIQTVEKSCIRNVNSSARFSTSCCYSDTLLWFTKKENMRCFMAFHLMGPMWHIVWHNIKLCITRYMIKVSTTGILTHIWKLKRQHHIIIVWQIYALTRDFKRKKMGRNIE